MHDNLFLILLVFEMLRDANINLSDLIRRYFEAIKLKFGGDYLDIA